MIASLKGHCNNAFLEARHERPNRPRNMGMRKVHIYELSQLNMVYALLSKRKLLWFVQNDKVDGCDDPRFPTVQEITRG
ncbi:hypothetical protein V6N13_107024 [Hibiscus sabdariffa]